MKLTLRACAIVVVLAVGLFAADSKDQTLTGTVSDTMCGAKHMMSGPAAECIRACVKSGSDYALVVGNKVYTLKGNNTEIDKFGGQQVTVTGKLSGNVVQVASIAPAKKS
jgi:hypothetical protein